MASRSSEVFQPMFPFGRFFGLSPFAMMREFSDEMDRMFRGNGSQTDVQAWAPAVDVRQCNGDLVVTAELPGLKKDEVKVEVTDDAIVIQGERRSGGGRTRLSHLQLGCLAPHAAARPCSSWM